MKRRRIGLERSNQDKLTIPRERELLEHYPLYEAEESPTSEIIYIFDSDIHGRYFISFANADSRFVKLPSINQQIYEVSFTPVNVKDPEKGRDPRIALTIIKAVEIFLESYGSPLVYVCDMNDLRHNCRSRLFGKWIEVCKSENYKPDSKEVEVWGTRLIFGVITLIHDKHFDKYFSELDSYKQYLQ